MKHYQEPTLDVTLFDAEDVVMASMYGNFYDEWLNVFNSKEGF